MPTRQYYIAGDFHISHRSFMISSHRIPPIVFSLETRRFLIQKCPDWAGLKKLFVCRHPTLGLRVGSVGRDFF